MGEEDVRTGILALEKNALFRDALRTFEPEGWDAPLRYAHFPRAEGQVLPAGETGDPGADPEDGADPAPLVLVHGTPDTMCAFGPLLFEEGGLAGRHDVYAIEIVGHGMAGGRGGGVTFQSCADHVAASIEALGLEGVTLVGNSYGGEFCWRAALDRPDLIARLVLIDSSGLPRAPEEFLPEEVKMREWGFAARLGYLLNSEPRVGHALDPHFDGGAPAERVREVFLCLENRGNWNATIDLARDEEGSRADELGSLVQPTLLVFGEGDIAYPPDTFGTEFARRIPDARLEVVEGAGHYPHESDPLVVARLIDAFARGL